MVAVKHTFKFLFCRYIYADVFYSYLRFSFSTSSASLALCCLLLLLGPAACGATIVQTLSSRYAIVLGGYGPGYTELSQVRPLTRHTSHVTRYTSHVTRDTLHVAQVEVVTHDRVCHGAVADIPPALARFLGDVSGVAEFVGEKVGSRGHVPRDT